MLALLNGAGKSELYVYAVKTEDLKCIYGTKNEKNENFEIRTEIAPLDLVKMFFICKSALKVSKIP